MNLPGLTLLLLVIGTAGWSAADVGMAPGDQPRWASTEMFAAAPVSDEPHACTDGTRNKVVLQAPRIDPTEMPETNRARIEQAVVDAWMVRMTSAGVPRDLLDRTLRMPNRTYELSNNDRVRAGCIAV